MKRIKYDCVENDNYITFVMDGETLEEIEIGTHGAPSQGRTIIGAKDLKNALELIDYQDVEKSPTTEEVADHEPCEWCKEDFRYTQGGMEKRRYADDVDYIDIECWGFCPVCGRKLKED
jgi:hypothetical protein